MIEEIYGHILGSIFGFVLFCYFCSLISNYISTTRALNTLPLLFSINTIFTIIKVKRTFNSKPPVKKIKAYISKEEKELKLLLGAMVAFSAITFLFLLSYFPTMIG